jgi:hypothetical protein
MLVKLAQYAVTSFSESDIEKAFDAVKDWQTKHSLHDSSILLGEFGTLRSGPTSGPDAKDRAKWTRAVRENAERRGFAWAHWEYLDVMGITVDDVSREVIPDMAQALGLNSAN